MQGQETDHAYLRFGRRPAYIEYTDRTGLIAEWLRHRYRMIICKQWKRIKTKMRNLRKLGIDKEKARQAANTSHGPFWATSHSTVNFAIINKRLEAAGCYDIEAAYNQMPSSY